MGRDDERPRLFDDDGDPPLKPWQGGPVEPEKLARRADPPTSEAAARALDPGRVGTVRRRLLAAVLATSGLTADEAAHRAGFDPADGTWKRMSDLKNLGLVEPTGATRPGLRSGRQQAVLRATAAGREAMR